MPYDRNEDVPDQIRDNASESCQTVWREAYNNAEDQYDDEETRVRVAWDAVEDVCSQNDDDVWTRDQEQNAAHERLASGAARLTGDDPADAYEARIVPIPEDETTTGLSGTTTNWPRETLKEATDRGVWDGVKILKGPGGSGHFDLGEQPPVENLAGKVTGARYEDGVGPVLDAELIDEQLARAVEHQLVSVSPDLSRELGAYDEQLGATPAERINNVAYITVLDTAASANATIEPATAEALGVHPDDFGENEGDRDQLADGITVSDPQYSGTVEDDWSAPTLSDTYDDDIQQARDAALIVRDTEGELTFDDLSLFVVDGAGNLNLAALRAAKSRAPQTEGVSGETLSRVQTKINTLASDEFDAEFGDEQNAPSTAVTAGSDQLARLQFLRFWPSAPVAGRSDELTDAADAVDALAGVDALLRTPTNASGNVTDAELVAVLSPDRADLGTLNEDLRDVLDGTPFALDEGYHWVPELETEALAAATDEAGDEQYRPSDEPAESGTEPPDTDTAMSDDPTTDELKEQLAAAQERADELEAQNEDLETEVEAKEERIETLEDENEQYRDEAEFSRRQAAMIASGGNEAVADTLVDSDRSADDLAEMALDSDHGAEVLGGSDEETDEEPEEDQLSPRERLQEQLAASPSPRGGQGADNTPGDVGSGQLTDEQLATANDRAVAAMSGNDIMQAQEEQLSGREYLRQHKDVDPAEYTSESALRNAVSNGSGGEN